MTISRILKTRFTSIFIALLMTMQISACSTEGGSTANANPFLIDFVSETGTDTNNMPEGTGTNNTPEGTGTNNTPDVSLSDISLSWVAPAEREDNTPLSLSEIAGYKVYYGATQGQYPNSVAINDSTAEGHTFTDLPAGTYYFVVTTHDTEGRESQYSSEIKKVI